VHCGTLYLFSGLSFATMLRRATKALRLLPTPLYRKGLQRGVAAAIEHEVLLRGLDLKTVVDVGANKGQYSLLCRSLFPEARIFAFEPFDSQADRFSSVFDGDERTKLFRCAAGRIAEKKPLNIHEASDGASFLPLGANHVGTSTVEVARLDEALKPSDIEPDALLKLDVQGYEEAVIDGALGIIGRFRYIVCEVAFGRFLDGQVLAFEIIEQLSALGFVVTGANQVRFFDDAPGQVDFLFTSRVSLPKRTAP
jgi:FkbM family methyltransferase